jgi:hypothetical protein
MKVTRPAHLILFVQVALLDMLWSFAHASISKGHITNFFLTCAEVILTGGFVQCEIMVRLTDSMNILYMF